MFNKESKKELEDFRESSNIIGKGTTFTGNLESSGTVRVEGGGKVIGDIDTKAKLSTGEGSYVEGEVRALNAEISGEIKGVVKCSELLILKATAVINGDIITDKLAVEKGAVFNGLCKMGAGEGKQIKLEKQAVGE